MGPSRYDAIIVGAGMSGMSAAIRLAMFDKKVLLLEKHSIAGGLNSYYQRRNKEAGGLRQFDVGLHALTNFVKKNQKGHPLTKLLKQLRISYDELKLCQQTFSKVQFPQHSLKFSNNFSDFENSIFEQFPHQVESFKSLVNVVRNFNELDLNLEHVSARAVLDQHISDPVLKEMILCPLLIYGSAWENDMDFAQFVIMFKSLYFEGFARPEGGVRTIIDLLLNKIKLLGAELRFKAGVAKILTEQNKAIGVELENGEIIHADMIFSSAGMPETMELITPKLALNKKPAYGPMSFMETILVLDRKIDLKAFDSTIVFYNNRDQYLYQKSQGLYDDQSAVVCCPDNYQPDIREGEGTLRITYIANYEQWKALPREEYLQKKLEVYESSLELAKKLIKPFDYKVLFHDVFSPTTIERYTWHKNGAVYGSTDKSRNGKTEIEKLYIIGTDQGFLGIVGAMLSGISMANLYGLMEQNEIS
jgi:phytoene dehydrogenase-like protein